MPRPVTVRSDLGKIETIRGGKVILKAQEHRWQSMIDFAAVLEDPETVQAAREDDKFFIALLDIAFGEYRVEKTDVADRISVSGAAVSRWAKGVNLPSGGTRRDALEAIHRIIDDYASSQGEVTGGAYRSGTYRKRTSE